MKKYITILFLFICLPAIAQWRPDSLLSGFSCRTVDQPDDYRGRVVSTIIRPDTTLNRGRGVLYIHGFNDYFFQAALADSVIAHDWNFRAVDLRRYGRSLRPGDKYFEARSISEYFPDIDSTLVDMKSAGIDTVVIIAHSTGGLIASVYMNKVAPPEVRGLILNSPFLDWNMSGFMRGVLVPVVSCIGGHFPNIRINQGVSTAYGESLLAGHNGEWHFDTSKKLLQSPPVTSGWIHAISEGQQYLHHHSDIRVPILLMHSKRSVDSEHVSEGDAVLNVDDISKWGRRLGPVVTEVTVDGALHDMILSREAVRREVYAAMFRWLSTRFD